MDTRLTTAELNEATEFIETTESFKETLDRMTDVRKIDSNDIYDILCIRRKIAQELSKGIDNKEVKDGYNEIFLRTSDLICSISNDKVFRNRVKKAKTEENYKNVIDRTKINNATRIKKIICNICLIASTVIAWLFLIGVICLGLNVNSSSLKSITIAVVSFIVTIIFTCNFIYNNLTDKKYVKVGNKDKALLAKTLYQNMYNVLIESRVPISFMQKNTYDNLTNQLLKINKKLLELNTNKMTIETLDLYIEAKELYEKEKYKLDKSIIDKIENGLE